MSWSSLLLLLLLTLLPLREIVMTGAEHAHILHLSCMQGSTRGGFTIITFRRRYGEKSTGSHRSVTV